MTEMISALIGALVGGMVAFWGGLHVQRTQRHQRIASLSAALAVEIAALVEMARRNRYYAELWALAEHVRSTRNTTPRYVVPATQSYFTVFEANAGDIGELDPKMAVEVIAFYQQARSWLDAVAHMPPPEAWASADNLAEHFEFLADVIQTLSDFGDQVAAQLAPPAVSGHIVATARRLDVSERHPMGKLEHQPDGRPPVRE